MNDVGGYNDSLTDADKTVLMDCGAVSISSTSSFSSSSKHYQTCPTARHSPNIGNADVESTLEIAASFHQSKFSCSLLVFFADRRKFDVVELDGISYISKQTDIFEVPSGQRVRIVVSSQESRGRM